MAAQKHTQTRVAFATIVGTSIEWYDYFLYAAASGLIFNELFFGPLGSTLSTMVAFATVGISFLFRPLGAFLAGHFGDKLGRRVVLIITLIAMGAATALIGFLPTFESAGVLAPILLIALRIVQGISAGGEWGGAVLLAVEHADEKSRGLRGSFPQIGVSIGLLLSSGVLALMTSIAPGDAFLEWGWRVPFFLSIVLVFVGYWIRRGVEESPVFHEIAERKEQVTNPLGKLIKSHWLLVILASLVFMGNNAAGYMTTGGYIQNYATDPAGPIGLERGPVLWAVAASAVSWLVFTIIAGAVSDKIGRRNTYILGWALLLVGIFSLFPLVNTGSVGMLLLGLVILTVGLGLHLRSAAGDVRRAVPLQRPLLRGLGLLCDRIDPRRCLRSDDREGPRVVDGNDHLGGGVPGHRRRARTRRDPAAARPHRHSAGPRPRGRAVSEPDHRDRFAAGDQRRR
jgi:MFS family permease